MRILQIDDAGKAREPEGGSGGTTFILGGDDQAGRVRPDPCAGQAFLPAGTELHEYRIEKVLGHGGFGVTYLARDTHLDKPVAIKEYLPAHLAVRNNTHVSARSPNEQRAFDWGRRQFLKEAQTLARFTHPNLVPVHRYFQAHETAYFVMSYVEGETFAARLKRVPEPTEDWLRAVLLPVMNGLKTVHRAGFLHRDIKPENIILQQDDMPVLIDFGAARVNLDTVTRSTICALTAGYAPLEQYGSVGHQGPWTDIYALGAVAYRAISGRKPPEAVNRIHNDPMVPARLLGQGRYSASFLEAIDWALAVHAEDRPRSIIDLQKAIAGQMRQERKTSPVPTAPHPAPAPAEAAPAEPANSFPWATAAAPVVAVGLILALFGGLRIRQVEPEQDRLADSASLPVAMLAAQPPVETVEPPAAKAAAPLVRKPVAQMEALSSFQDCPNCPAMVVLPNGTLAIGRHEVTEAQYRECVGAGACRKPAAPHAAGNLPAVNVSWNDAKSYAAWLSRKTGRRYRLPTEAEWEYAARSGTRTDRFWGADNTRHCQYANAAEPKTPGARACRDGYPALAAVGSFKPNWFDLHDTAGNAWELTADCWRDAGGAEDCTRRAARGGSWRTPAEALRSTSRSPVQSTHRSDTLGFRVAAD